MYILNHWPEYFKNRDEGMGTTYERFILHRHFEKLKAEFDVVSVLESPSFGMTGVSGINSMWWAARGVEVTVTDHDNARRVAIKKVWREVGLPVDTTVCDPRYDTLPFSNKRFDLGWNFAALQFVRDIRPLLAELVRVVKKAIVICIPNRHNPLVSLRIHKERGRAGLYYGNARRETIVRLMAGMQWREHRHFSFDVPPWPDIAMSKEEMLKRVGLSQLANHSRPKAQSPLCILDYFAGEAPSMPHKVLRLDRLERLPESVRKYWAHHQWMLFVPAEEDV